MDTAALLAKFGWDAPEPVYVPDVTAYGPWFHMMASEVKQTDEQLGSRDIGSLNLEAAFGLPGAENLNATSCIEILNAWSRLVN